MRPLEAIGEKGGDFFTRQHRATMYYVEAIEAGKAICSYGGLPFWEKTRYKV